MDTNGEAQRATEHLEDYFTPRECAARLKVHENTIRNMVAAGELRAIRFRRRVRIPLAEVLRFEAAHTIGGAS